MKAMLVALLLLCLPAQSEERSPAYRWLDVCLESEAREVDRNGARPTILSRSMAMTMTAMFDAWAAYSERAVGTRLGSSLRRPQPERTDRNREIAISYAVYRTLLALHPEDAAWLEDQIRRAGQDPDNRSHDPANPAGVGNLAAEALLDYRWHDGANQLGDEPGCSGKPYSDYTGYQSVNPPEQILDPDRWQPITFEGGKTPGYLTPHWDKVRPFALERAEQFRPPPPPKVGSPELQQDVAEVLRLNASLTPQQKALVEFMRDGPRSTGQSGHWLRFAQDVSRRDRQNLEQDVKLFFVVANVAMDAFIAAWDCKRVYDTSRPWTLIHHYYRGQIVRGWAGPGLGVVSMPGEKWCPYSPMTFVTPPFPGYVSGHSTVSAACARTLELFTGSDDFGFVERRQAGTLTEPGVDCSRMQSKDGTPDSSGQSCLVALPMPTFSEVARMAGQSRVLGGYHIQADNREGLLLGQKVADFDWPRLQLYFGGDPCRLAGPRLAKVLNPGR